MGMRKLTRQTIKILNKYLTVKLLFVNLMCMVKLYVTITVVFLSLMCTVKLYIVIIHYYTYIGSRKEEYFNGSKRINKNGALKRSRTR